MSGFAYEFLCIIMFWFLCSFWCFFSNLFDSVFGFITRYHGGEKYKKSAFNQQEDDILATNISKIDDKKLNSKYYDEALGLELWEIKDSKSKRSHEEETESSVFVETSLSSNTNKYCIMNKNHVYGFMEAPRTMSFTVHELFSDEANHDSIRKDFETEDVHEEKTEEYNEIMISSEENLVREKQETSSEPEFEFSGESEIEESETKSLTVYELLSESNEGYYEDEVRDFDSIEKDFEEAKFVAEDATDEKTEDFTRQKTVDSDEKVEDFTKHDLSDNLQSENPLFVVTFETSSINPSDDKSSENHQMDLTTDELQQNQVEIRDKTPCLTEDQLLESSMSDQELEDSDDESYIHLEPETYFFNERVFSQLNFRKPDENQETMDDTEQSQQPNLQEKEDEFHLSDSEDKQEAIDSLEKPQEPNLQQEVMDNLGKPQEPTLQQEEQESDLLDSDEEMEHQDYINQLRQELKYVKSGGLPTILEDLESPKMLDDMKPMKIEKRMEHKDRIQEIQKFYKIYVEKMRKLDILSYQTMHSIDLLKLKTNSTQSNSTKKYSIPPLKSLLSQTFKQSKLRNTGENTVEKYIRELKMDYELVYVGQVCNSWEILHWQLKKAKELQNYDPHGFKQYNYAATEFQQFKVLLERFIENEPFQDRPRIQNYIANRSVLRSFLQVPSIGDDSMKDKKARQEEKYAVSINMLTDIISESMRLFWEFIRSDKEECSISSRDVRGDLFDVDDLAHSEILMDIREKIQKKEKRVKELMRTRSCIVKRFQKNHGDEEKLDYSLLKAQIDLKLVEKVIKMSKLTREQLTWCHTKLDDINLLSRKICLEPSNFLLFLPC